METAAPVKPRARLEFVDILRGFALFGVLAANMSSFSGYSAEVANYTDFLDGAVLVGIQFFIRAKFYTLFSFLFGWGMAMQMLRAAEKGHRFLPLFVRRMAILLGFGLIHGLFIWHGDILTLYALLGFLLLLFRKTSQRTLLIIVPLLLLFTIVLNLPVDVMNQLRGWYAEITSFMRQGDLPNNVYADGDLFLVIEKNMQDYWAAQSWFIFYFGNVFSMFLLGLYVGKKRIFQEVDQYLSLLRGTMIVGLVFGVVFNALFVWNTLHPEWIASEYNRFTGIAARTIAAPAMTLFYISGLTLLMRNSMWLERLRPLGYAGRMALSNYLLQSVVCVLIFYGYGLGLYGKTDPTFGMIVTILLFFSQIRLSRRFLLNHSYGPMEWLWRSLTYGRRQPWRKADEIGEPAPNAFINLFRSTHPAFKIGIIAFVLVLVTAALFFLNRETDAIKNSALSPVAEADPTATRSLPAAAESVPTATPAPIVTPFVEPVTYQPGSLARQGDMRALAAAFDPAKAIDQIEILAGPPFDGRRAGSEGGLKSGDYIAEQFAEFGLHPAGDDGTFFQAFPISYTNLAEAPHLQLILDDGTIDESFEPFADYSPLIRDYVGQGQVTGPVVWMNQCSHADFEMINVVDKVVLCRPEAAAHLQAHRDAVEHGAGGLLIVTDSEARPTDMGDRFTQAWIPQPIPALRVYPELVDALFAGSGTTITETALLEQPQILSSQIELSVSTLGDKACPTVDGRQGCTGRNVLGLLRGRDPEYAHELIILGAHYDHLGSAPTGVSRKTVWAGANDNASGTAALLEIARSWQEQGYVPRRSVLFAAWDAEELGLLGSTYYVAHPRYRLENVQAKINLDMVGAGGDVLNIDGAESLLSAIRTASEGIDYPVLEIRLGRSDHVPFLLENIPAALLIWLDENGQVPEHYHRPADIAAVIDSHKLETAGELAALTALNLAENEPAILAMLADRAAAAAAGDREAFLETSHPNQHELDDSWFADLVARQPLSVTISAANLQIFGDIAAANTSISAVYVEDGTSTQKTVSGSLQAQFQRTDNGWLWAGPHFIQLEDENVTLSYPVEVQDNLAHLPAAVRDQYSQIANALALDSDVPLHIQLFPDAESLRSSTALFAADSGQTSVAAGVANLVYTKSMSQTVSNCRDSAPGCPTGTLVQLALANSGLAPQEKSWLWQGLPEAWQAEADPIAVQSRHIPVLQQALLSGSPMPSETAAWAAVDFAIEQVGWAGLFQWDDDTRWQPAWKERLYDAQFKIDRLLEQRTTAVLSQDESAFLDTAVPELSKAQQRWLADLEANPLSSFSQSAVPIAFVDDGSILARVTMYYELTGRGPSAAEMTIRFVPANDGYLWAGKYLYEIDGEDIIVRYPTGFEDRALAVQRKLSDWTPKISAMLSLSPTLPVEVELYNEADDMRAAIALPYSAANWTEPGHALKMQANAGDGALAVQLTRHLLGDAGVHDEWLLRGIAANLAARVDEGATHAALTGSWSTLTKAAAENSWLDLNEIRISQSMNHEENILSDLQSWDAVRYYIHTEGWNALVDKIKSDNSPADDVFQQNWRDSFTRAHISPEWLEIAAAYNAEQAVDMINYLASHELAGRRAGSEGAELAASAIAEGFAAAGLQPAGDDGTFFQTFPITVSETIATPQIEIITADGSTIPLLFREEFLPVQPANYQQVISGDLYFVQDSADYGDTDFQGAIVIRQPAFSTAEEIALADEHNAGALILTSFKHDDDDLYGKQPGAIPDPGAIPVLELTSDGLLRLLSAYDIKSSQIKNLLPIQPLEGTGSVFYAAEEARVQRARSVLGYLPGTDPVLGRELIVVGAHYDFAGDDQDGRRYGGANDASGVATLLEIAKLWQQTGYQPQRSMLFAAWGAQELGNLGSQYYAAQPAKPLSDTIAMIQIEGVGGGNGFDLGAQGDEQRDGWLSSNLETAVSLLDDKLVITPKTSVTDLESFAEQHFPSLLISWRLAGDTNLPDDLAVPVEEKNLRFSGQAAALLLMSLAQ